MDPSGITRTYRPLLHFRPLNSGPIWPPKRTQIFLSSIKWQYQMDVCSKSRLSGSTAKTLPPES